MKEIGGYFGLEQLISDEYYKDLIALNASRNALLYVLKARSITKLYIPYYLCDSVSQMCEREGYNYSYYKIKQDFTPDFDKALSDGEYIYIVNYYGQLNNECLLSLNLKYTNIIVDNVQAFFQKPLPGVDTIYSCRKFFGVPDGSYLSTNCYLKEVLETDVSLDRMKHILGRFEGGAASEYYEAFKSNDESFYNLPLKKMSKLTHNILGAIDYEKIKKAREDNFRFLNDALGEMNPLNVLTPVGSFAYPFYCKNGIEIRKQLAKKKIYVPTLWPNVINSSDEIILICC